MISRKRRASSISSKHDDDPMPTDESTPEQSPLQSSSLVAVSNASSNTSASSTGSIVSASSARKKRKLDPTELCQSLYDSIRSIKKEDGSTLCDTFIRAPKRRQEPSYYDVVNNPIDLLKIQQKLKTDVYDDLDDLMQDFELLINNAKAFYKPDSNEYQDAVALWQHIVTNKQRILESLCMAGFGGEEEPKSRKGLRGGGGGGGGGGRRLTSTTADDEIKDDDGGGNTYEELFAAVMSSVDASAPDRPLHRMFLLLPSKKIYPDYYDVIEHPIDLRLIATKIQTNAYSNLLEMERDLLQMTKNACQFNEPGSQIYKDAKTLKKIFSQKRLELEAGLKTKPTRRSKALSSASIAALKEEADSSDDDETSKKGEGPMWALFDHLYNAPGHSEHPGTIGPPLGTSLWKLPVRRFHPEYYELISRPISMCQIHTKLNKGEYANISDLTGDLYLMLDNAKKAFSPTHRTHKDAVKMLKLMNTKLVEDCLDHETSELDEEEEEPEEEEPEEGSSNNNNDKKKKGRPRINSNTTTTTTIVNVINTSTPISTANTNTKSTRIPINAVLKKKILSIQKYLVDYTLGNRRPIELFMEKPPRKIYPDYYDIIQTPIDMNTIEHNIRSDKYKDLEDVISDYRLMFANCRQYNEEGSNIYEDANTLEKALNEKLKEFPGLNEIKKPLQKMNKNNRRKTANNVVQMSDKLWQFYETIRDYQEPKGKRQLSLIFTKLPSKTEYPDYYDIIKEPIDMERIAIKLKQNLYETIDELAADFLLMLENACKYNEPDSQIYKDALVLQQLTLQMKQNLRNDREAIPDVSLAVQEIFLTLFTSLYNHQDEAGRCYSDSLLELPEYDDDGGGGVGVGGNDRKIRGISLDLVKRRLDKGVYKRLDIFQEDVFACMERARKLARTDSDVFQDSVELQTHYIKKRDEICADTLSSTALNYNLNRLMSDVETVRQQKLSQEDHDQDQEDKEDMYDAAEMQGESMVINQKVFSPGDFVYFQHNENKIPSIAYIERLWTTEDNDKMMHGAVFLRPHETYHLTTRKFLEKEMFKSSVSQTIPMERVLGKCYIMHIKDYIKLRPDNFEEKDVFVCESRYNVRARSFKKFKNWPFVRENDPVKFVMRDKPLEIKRVLSVFKERIEKHKGELEELKLQEALVEKEKPNVVCDPPPPSSSSVEPNSVYYQQFNTICSGVVKTGDFVYVATQSGKQSIAQIHQIWENNNKSYFKGPWLLTPNEISPSQPSSLGKQFYRQELLLSTVEEISPVIAIVGRCAVLEYQDYISSRPTEFPESDVFIVEAAYDELKKSLRKFTTTGMLRKFKHSLEVTQDEIFYFKSPIKPQKDVKYTEIQEAFSITEDSMDGNPPSVCSDVANTSSPAPSTSTPYSTKKGKAAKKSLTGYILYSSEVRKGICSANPEASFGDISRMVGNEWKNLPSSVKQSWEDRASRINEETAARREQDETLVCANSPAPNGEQPSLTYECQWDKCDFQFEELADCSEHCLSESTGHIVRGPPSADAEYICLWRNCLRMKKNMQAFPTVLRLTKHVREVHLTKAGRIIPVGERSKNYMPKKTKPTPILSQHINNTPVGSSAVVPISSLSPRTPAPGNNTLASTSLVAQDISTVLTEGLGCTVVAASSGPCANTSYGSVSSQQGCCTGTNAVALPGQTALEPMFVTVPPRPQKVLHSEAYIKYISSLQGTPTQTNVQTMANWKRTLTPLMPNAITKAPSTLPSQWLGRYGEGSGEDVVKALCHLRNFMMNDVLQIQRNCL